MNGPYLNSRAAALALGIGRSTLYRWAQTGYIKPAFVTPSGQRRWDLADVKRQLAAHSDPPVIAAIVTSKQGVLITRRHDGKPLWGFPTGTAMPGEAPEDAAIREVKEECDLLVKVGHRLGERDHPLTGRHMIYLACRPYQGTGIRVADEAELAEVRWVNLTEAEDLLPGMFSPAHEHLERVLT
jgi:8-oxo-dGTP pyrophosphatase MutT (NUDIX family)